MLLACAPVGSSPSGPPKKTEAQALKALGDATEELGKKIELEIDARKAYVAAAVRAGETPKTAMLRLLRRIVVMGVTKADVERLLQKWQAAQKAVEQVEQKIKSLIAELKSIDSPTAKDAATKTETKVKEVVAVVQKVREAKDPTTIDQVAQDAKKIVAAKTEEAKKTVKKAKETAKKNEEAKKERSKLPDKTLIYTADLKKYYTLSGESGDISRVFFEESVPGLPPAYTVLKTFLQQGTKFYVRGPGGAPTPVKDAPAGGEIKIKTRYSVYRGDYVYYNVKFENAIPIPGGSGTNRINGYEIWRFRPEQPQNAERLVGKHGGKNFAVDTNGTNGNVLYQDSINASNSPTKVLKLRLAEDKWAKDKAITPSLDGTNPIASSPVNVVSGVVGGTDVINIYLLKKTGSKTLQLYEFATQAETLKSASDTNKKYVVNCKKGDKFVRITQKTHWLDSCNSVCFLL